MDKVLNVPITNKLLVSAASARQKYETYLELQRQQEKSALKQRKRKSTFEEKHAQKDHESLVKHADDMCIKAETTGKLELLSQANASRQEAKDKLTVIHELDKKTGCKARPA